MAEKSGTDLRTSVVTIMRFFLGRFVLFQRDATPVRLPCLRFAAHPAGIAAAYAHSIGGLHVLSGERMILLPRSAPTCRPMEGRVRRTSGPASAPFASAAASVAGENGRDAPRLEGDRQAEMPPVVSAFGNDSAIQQPAII